MSSTSRFALLILFFSSFFSSCLKKDYERPPDTTGYDPQIAVTHTLQDLLQMNVPYSGTGSDTFLVPQNVWISGIVTADDRSGNLFKRIVIDDGSAALTVLINVYSLYNDYPVGRKVYINCGGLHLGYEGGLPVIGAGVTEQLALRGIEGAQLEKHIVKGNVGNKVVPQTVDLATARLGSPELFNRLITIPDVQFADAGLTYTQPNATSNRDIRDCDFNTLVVRSSNYAKFASYALPEGRGSITGIYTVYISSGGTVTPQLVIRDTSDVQLNMPRCGAGPGAAMVSIDSLRLMYTLSSDSILGQYTIRGIVISDRRYKNQNGQNIVIQDGERGIVVRFSTAHTFDLGDELEIELVGASLSEYNNLLQVGPPSGGTFPPSRAVRTGTGKSVTPKLLAISQIIGSDFEKYESTLVKIMNVDISSGTYSGNKSLKDATNTAGTLKLYTIASATFSGETVPSRKVNITGILGQYRDTKQLSIRNTTDVE